MEIFGGEDTRYARRAARESEVVNNSRTQGSPRKLGQPWALFLDPVGVVFMRAAREAQCG